MTTHQLSTQTNQVYSDKHPSLTAAELPLWLALWRTEGIGPVQFNRILDAHGSVQNYYQQNPSLKQKINWLSVEKDLNWANSPDCFILTLKDDKYPARLKEIHSAPPVLFIQGNIDLLSLPQIGMVGSRHPTPLGADTAYQFAKSFAAEKLIITSGLAIGIDSASHQGALDVNGSTIAIMGTGPDIIYPKRHQALSQKIIDNGCLVTEFPTGVSPAAMNFPRRNRLISGLSLGILVVEAAFASGSLITAKYALEQNREVFAIPGSIQNPLARGCHALIKQGAKLVETAQDLMEEIKPIYFYDTGQPAEKNPNIKKNLKNMTDPADNNPFLKFIGFDTTPVDAIIQKSHLTAEKVSSMLLMLELEGHIVSVPGGYTRLNQV